MEGRSEIFLELEPRYGAGGLPSSEDTYLRFDLRLGGDVTGGATPLASLDLGPDDSTPGRLGTEDLDLVGRLVPFGPRNCAGFVSEEAIALGKVVRACHWTWFSLPRDERRPIYIYI